MISNKTSIWVFVSGFWVFYWLMIAMGTDDNINVTHQFIAFGPLLVGWGMWWFRR